MTSRTWAATTGTTSSSWRTSTRSCPAAYPPGLLRAHRRGHRGGSAPGARLLRAAFRGAMPALLRERAPRPDRKLGAGPPAHLPRGDGPVAPLSNRGSDPSRRRSGRSSTPTRTSRVPDCRRCVGATCNCRFCVGAALVVVSVATGPLTGDGNAGCPSEASAIPPCPHPHRLSRPAGAGEPIADGAGDHDPRRSDRHRAEALGKPAGRADQHRRPRRREDGGTERPELQGLRAVPAERDACSRRSASGSGFNAVYMRGIATGGDGQATTSQPSVGMYLDEQPITTIQGNLDVHLYDIARVEALAGPQGTLYGASSQAGTIRIITNKPDPSAFAAGYSLEGELVDMRRPRLRRRGLRQPAARRKRRAALRRLGARRRGLGRQQARRRAPTRST